MKLMHKRICAFLLAAVMLMGVVPAFSVYAEDAAETEKTAESAEKTEETAKTESSEKVVFDWNCDYIDFDTVKPSGNNYPAYYFADFTTKGVEKGTVHMGGDGSEKHYASLIIKHESTKAAVTLDVDMKIKSLTTPAATVMQRGFVIEWELPNNKLIYLVLQNLGEEDENGKNATLRVSKMDRSAENGYEERIYIPTDDEFHKWTFQYDGESLLRISIDGEILKDFHDVDVFHNNEPGRLQFKNIILDMAPDSDLNDVTFDNVKITEGTTLAYSEITKAIVAADATAEKFTVTAGVNRLEEDGELTVTVFPRGEEEKAVSTTVKSTELTADVTLEELPFDGMCTVVIDYTGAQSYSFNYYVYKSMEKIEAKAEVEAEEAGEMYVFSDLSSVKLPADSTWYTVDWETAADKGVAVCTPAVADVTSLTVPVKLTGKYAVFAGYVEGSSGIAVNGTNAALGAAGPMGYYIYDAFVTAVDLDGEEITLSNMPFAAAQIAYLKFVSLSDELYDVATREDDSHTFITDNDGFSTLCGTTHGNYETLFKDDFMTPYEKIDQRQFIWCTFSTSMLNYDSEVWWEYVTKRLKELNIPEDKWPKDFLDHVDTKGNRPDFSDIMRTADVNAFNNMRSLNETGYPHAVLADMVKENIEDGEIYISLRMSHYNGGTFAFQTGAYFYLHPEWKRGGGNQLSYMYEDYRNYLHDILIEMAQPENVDGILMDFGRYYYIFGDELTDVQKRTEIMNEFVKSVRDDMPEGKKLTVRVLNPTDEKAFAWGLDYKHWVEEGWVDRVYISDQSHETFFDFDEYIAYFEEHPEVEFYLGVNATLSGHDMTRAEEDILKAGGTIPKGERVSDVDIMLRVYDFYEAGADGVFTFNWAGTDAMFKNMNNATLMRKWYHFSYPLLMMSTQPVRVDGAGSLPVTSAVSVPMMQIPACDTAAALTVEARAELLPFPVTDAAWAAALTVNKAENPSLYTRFGKTGQAAYHYDAGTDRLYLSVTYDLASWIGDLSLVDAYGNEIPFRTDRLYGTPKEGNTLWSHSYADSGHADAVKTLWLFVENVTRLPDKYVLYVRNTGTTAYYTAKLTVDFPDTGIGEETDGVPGDVNGDGVFDYYDVARLYAFHRGKAVPEADTVTDVNGDGVFDYYDVSKLYAVHRGKGSFD